MSNYGQMAYVYDQLMKDVPYDEWLEFTKTIFKKANRKIEKIADLGCGTGQMTLRLAEAGYQTFGVDNATDMLTYAAQEAMQQKLKIQWIEQDLRDLSGLEGMDAVVSYCDVINYITDMDDLKKVFNHVMDMLHDDGIFLFDVHSMHHVDENLTEGTFAYVTEDMSYIWFCEPGDHAGEMYHDLTFYTQLSENFARFDEYHHQRTYPIEIYEQLLTEAGFKKIAWYSKSALDGLKENQLADRIYFVAEK